MTSFLIYDMKPKLTTMHYNINILLTSIFYINNIYVAHKIYMLIFGYVIAY